jgi:hypothetical protein
MVNLIGHEAGNGGYSQGTPTARRAFLYSEQGRGTTKSRLRHALLAPFVCRADNGKRQPNYPSLGGDLATGAIANLYYPASNRGAGLVFSNFAIGTAERVGASVAQEFLLGKLTHRGGHIN